MLAYCNVFCKPFVQVHVPATSYFCQLTSTGLNAKDGHMLWEPQENTCQDFTGSVDKWMCVGLNCVAVWIVLEQNPTYLVPGP